MGRAVKDYCMQYIYQVLLMLYMELQDYSLCYLVLLCFDFISPPSLNDKAEKKWLILFSENESLCFFNFYRGSHKLLTQGLSANFKLQILNTVITVSPLKLDQIYFSFYVGHETWSSGFEYESIPIQTPAFSPQQLALLGKHGKTLRIQPDDSSMSLRKDH